MVHSLESVNYLKIDKQNLINFKFATDNKVISILQQYEIKVLNTIEHNFMEVQNI